MSKGTVTFVYNGKSITIQCLTNEKFNKIFEKLYNKRELDSSQKYYFLHNGDKLQNEALENLNFEEIANEDDKNNCTMNILIYDEAKDIYDRDKINNNDNNNEYEKNIKILINNIDKIIKGFQEIKENVILQYNNIINYKDNTNYEKIHINEYNKYNKIIKDINLILNDIDKNNELKNIMNIFQTINNNKRKNNIIIGEIEIKNEDLNKNIRIINSYEEFRRNNIFKRCNVDNDSQFNNEKEIKDNCVIKIDGEIIPFNYFHIFNETGKHTIEYSFLSNITKTCYMFFGCEKLININLSNLNSQNINNMRSMFSGCRSLTYINFGNFNTQKVVDLCWMLDECQSLKEIDLSSFNTQNVKNMYGMFKGCKFLRKINLSNFDTQNVKNMEFMFRKCDALIEVNLSNFNSDHVGTLENMFKECDIKKLHVITKDKKILSNVRK